MAIILNIETSTDIGSVCLSEDQKILSFVEGSAGFTHAKETTLMVKKCLQEANLEMEDLAAVAVSSGPGSYTALRIGTSVAKGLCYGLEIPLIAINTLESLAQAAARKTQGDWFVPMIDARRMEVYTQIFDAEVSPVSNKQALILDENTFAEKLSRKETIVLVGNGAEKFKKTNSSPLMKDVTLACSAEFLVPLAVQKYRKGEFSDVAYYEPYYLKPPNITTPKKIL